jgi:hypothetical protein
MNGRMSRFVKTVQNLSVVLIAAEEIFTSPNVS